MKARLPWLGLILALIVFVAVATYTHEQSTTTKESRVFPMLKFTRLTDAIIRVVRRTDDLLLEECPLHTETPEWAAQMPAQVEAALQRGAKVIGLTELAGSHPAYRAQVTALAAEYGYTPYFSGGDAALLYKSTLKEAVTWDVDLGGEVSAALSFFFHGRRVTVFVTHWPVNTTTHAADRDALTAALVTEVKKASAGTGVTFFMADSNPSKPLSDPTGQPRADLDAGGMVLVGEELGSFPAGTGVTTVGRNAGDKAVKAASQVISPTLGSDHHPLTVTYKVTRPLVA